MPNDPRNSPANLFGIPYGFWILLTLPFFYIGIYGVTHGPRPMYLRHTGLFACWFLIAALAVTPLGMLFGPRNWVRWLKARRRYLGVAAFAFATLHLLVFLKDTNAERFLSTFTRWPILAGWLGFAVMAAMAATSSDLAVRRMGTGWKRLQQWVYAGAVLVLIHWAFSERRYTEVALYTVPLILLMAWRVMRRRATP